MIHFNGHRKLHPRPSVLAFFNSNHDGLLFFDTVPLELFPLLSHALPDHRLGNRFDILCYVVGNAVNASGATLGLRSST